MTTKILSRLFFFPVLLIITGLSSCSLEKKLADNFIKTRPEIDLQVFTPGELFKYNHKGEEIEGFQEMSDAAQDSALYVSSRYIQFVNDSVFLENYVNSFIDEMRALGFKVYLDNAVDSFLHQQPQAYVVNIAQVQLDEYKFPLEDSEPYGDTVYYKSFKLNAVDACSWFELNKINVSNPKKTVLYSSFTSSDSFDGRFILNGLTMNVQYKYKIDSLELKDIYEMASYAGKKNASYLFDFFMNQYIAIHFPQGEQPQQYMHYNRFRKSVSATEGEGFEVLESK